MVFLSIPYGKRNMFVLVIGKTELIIITANQELGIISNTNNGVNIIAKITGVITTVSIKILLTQVQCSTFSSDLSNPNSFFSSDIFRSLG